MSPRSCDVLTRARRVRAVVLDVDGVLTDGSLYYGTRGESLKRFAARDGFGIKAAQAQGLHVAVLSGRVAAPLASRLADLGVEPELVIQGSRDKSADLDRLAATLGLDPEEMAVVGDDIPDLPALRRAGLAACPADAVPEVRRVCHLVCRASGGNGAVREVIETVLRAQGRWASVLQVWGASVAEVERPPAARRPRPKAPRR
ncbi:MAG: HAD family hydrolase [Thermoanaerobaculaceae bacterium]|nr:HAD family hydrolase [Thermoanaerobaculaceae bacterium]